MSSTGRFRSEEEFVGWLRQSLPQAGRGLRVGIGDDAAIVEVSSAKQLLLTTDMSIEGVHFSRRLHPPRSVGHRALARALSDVAAMGGVARFALISLSMARTTPRTWVEGFYSGVANLGRQFGVKVIGGDAAVGPELIFADVVVAGEVNPIAVLRRSGARAGDKVFVSGRLGESALGLQLLKSRAVQRGGRARRAVRVHLYPQQQCWLGRFLAEARLASALIDISDGLSADLARLCAASGVGARLWATLIPGPASARSGKSPDPRLLELALHGGEDYQLLFTVPERLVARVPARFRGIPLRRIGEITSSKELSLVGPQGKASRLPVGGYDHFRKA